MANRPPLVAWMNPLPMELAPALRKRRSSLASVASGQVLDLGGWSDHLDSYRIATEVGSVTMLDRLGDVRAGTATHDPQGVTRIDAEPEELSELGHGPFDTIVSLIRTPLVADLNRFLRTLTELLADGGRLLFLEPVAHGPVAPVACWRSAGVLAAQSAGYTSTGTCRRRSANWK